MPVKKVNTDEIKVTYRKGQDEGEDDAIVRLEMGIKRLKPQPGEIMLVRGLPPHIDPQAVFARLNAMGGLNGAKVWFLPENITIDLLPEAFFAEKGYVKVEEGEEE